MIYGKNSLGVNFKDLNFPGIDKRGTGQDKTGMLMELQVKYQKLSSQVTDLKIQAGGSTPQQAQ